MNAMQADSCPFPYRGPVELEAPVRAALARVVDPELSLSIVDVGLVYGIDVAEGVVQVKLTMTSPACPMSEVVLDDAGSELRRVLPEGYAVDLQLVWEPPWEPARLSAKARLLMGW